MKKLILLLCCFPWAIACSQQAPPLQWWNPLEHSFRVIEGQAWPDEGQDPYDRLPARAEEAVGPGVWGNAKKAAGLMIRFRSNAPEIQVRFGVQNKNGGMALNHMPATGVSGVDLYAIDSDGKEIWCAGKRSFGDTVRYVFPILQPNDGYHDQGREYRLYLPLYNQVNWLEIGVGETAYFEALPVRQEKPIVVYGTSIAQGACASRPGMAWTAILGRKLDRPVINLGFSGWGRLETPVIDLLTEIDAKVYILDCLPNLVEGRAPEEELKKRVRESVHTLKAKHPQVPVLLVDHAGYTEEFVNPERQENYREVNRWQQEAYYQLQREGVQGLYYLTHDEIGLEPDDMVDGTHPTDLGMWHYAEAYEKRLREILCEPIGTASTTQPVTQYREPNNYDWEQRHRELLDMGETDPPKTVFLANSIIHFWGGLPRTKLVREEASWETIFTTMGLRNYAYGWDRVENVLWRVYHGELEGFAAERVLVMIGTNNLHLNTDAEIIEGLTLLVQAIKVRQPGAEIVLMGLLPRRAQEERVVALNRQIARLAGDSSVKYADLGELFLQEDQRIDEGLFSDGLHPNASGYRKLREALRPLLEDH